MGNMDKARLKEILLNPQDFIGHIDTDDWVIIKKKEDIKGFTDQEIIESKSYFLSHSMDFIIDILDELKIDSLNIE